MDIENKTENSGSSESRIPAIHTYRSDLDQAVHDQGASLASIMLAEKKKKEDSVEEIEKKEVKKSATFVIVGIILIALSIASVYIFKNAAEKASTVDVSKESQSLYISHDKVTHINAEGLLGKETFGKVINKARAQAGNQGQIEELLFEKNNPPVTLSTIDFFTALGSGIPSTLLNAIDTNMTLGIYTTPNLDRHAFFIFGIKDYERALSGIMTWERTIIDDMFTIFNIQTNGEYSSIMQANFEDVVINNKNARIIRDIRGNPALYILFINKDLLVITDNEDAVQEITNRNLMKNAKPL